MKKLNHLDTDAERMTDRIFYYISMIVIFLILFFGACHILNRIIDPCLEMLESLAENAMRMGVAIAKILVVVIFMTAIYYVFFDENEK